MLDHFLPYEYSPQNLNWVDDYNAVMTQVMAAWYMRNDIGVCVDAVLLDDAALGEILVPCELWTEVYGLYLKFIGYRTLFRDGDRFLKMRSSNDYDNEWRVDISFQYSRNSFRS